tara:strand:+ start:1877 stop:6067 length:4191 start_codon:yes stop_codon:yes gene_type:complete
MKNSSVVDDSENYSDASGSSISEAIGFQEGFEGSKLSVGKDHVCWIAQEESVNCKGGNLYGQLGTMGGGISFFSIETREFGNFVSLSSGYRHTCSISERSLVICWGQDWFGQSSGKIENEFFSPPSVIDIGGEAAISSSSGKFHSCALTIAGSVWCWGNFGLNSQQNPPLPPTKIIDGRSEKAISISSGKHHACSILSDRTVRCWGENSHNQVSEENTDYIPTLPHATHVFGRILAISLGEYYTCALTFSGDFECWGNLESLGFEATDSSVKIDHNLTNPGIISSGFGSICLLELDGLSDCWGGMKSSLIPAIYPTLAIGLDDYCFVEVNASELSCSRIGVQQTESEIMGGIKLESFDYDKDGVLNHADDFPRDSERSIICPPGSFGYHYCEDSPPGTFIPEFKSISFQNCPMGTFQSNSGQTSCTVSPPGTYVDFMGAESPIPCPPGTFSNESGSIADNCQITDPGHWTPEGSPIQFSCQPGTFQPSPGQGSCINAGKGNYSDVVSATSGKECPPGEFQNLVGQNNCILANPGYYVPGHGSSFETPCPSGTYNPDFGSSSINSCQKSPPGAFSLQGFSEPIPCPSGKFQPEWSSSNCIDSSPGFFVDSENSTFQVACGAGYFQPDISQSICLLSPSGHYVDIIGSNQTFPCPRGFFQPLEGQSNCHPSSPGYFVDDFAASSQKPCPEGTYNYNSSSVSILQCQITPPGSYSSPGSDSFHNCSLGTFQPLGGQSTCLPSDVGFYVDSNGSSSQNECPENSSTISNYSTSISDCLSPLPGNFIDENSESAFSPCPLGEFQPYPGQDSCQLATPGFYVDSIGASSQIPCPPGTYSNQESATSLDSCQNTSIGHFSLGGVPNQTPSPPGHYIDYEGSSSPSPCPAGTFSPVIGATSIATCQQSPIGTYSPIGSPSPISCQPGSFQPISGQSLCIESSPGNYTNGIGETRQLPCVPGFFQPNTSASSCIKSQLGYYVDSAMSSFQIQCPGNSTTVNLASKSISDCLSMPGFFIDSNNIVEICPLGTFQPLLGQQECLASSPGNYVDSTGSTSQSPCPNGSFNEIWSSISIDECRIVRQGYYLSMDNNSEIPCPPGSYQPVQGMSNCIQTDPGYFSPYNGTISQLPCDLGTFQPSHSSSFCILSDPGSFVDSMGSSEQKNCPNGTYQPHSGSYECLTSDPGYYVPTNSRNLALPCPPGTYQPDFGSISCISVSNGYFAKSEANSEQKMCPAGTYRNSEEWLRGDKCLETPAGKFSFAGSSVPSLCPVGTFSPEPRAKSSSDCRGTIPGTFAEMEGSTSPTLCAPGTYQPENRATSCLVAPINTFVSTSGAAEFRPCTSGGYTLHNSSTSSTDCIFDQDGDGILDREDSLVHIKGDKLPIMLILYGLFANVVLVVWISTRGE